MKKDAVWSSKLCADRLKALADADRLRIVQLLRGGPKNVGQITAVLDMTIAMVSHHLQILKREKIVATEKFGRFAVYRLHPDVFADSSCLDLGCCKLRLPA
jgi:ArsR family transcriptional regulator